MKFQILFGLLAVTYALANKCPLKDGQFATLYAHESDPTKYYHCSNGHAYLMHCPATLVFNPVLSVCDYPNSIPNPDPEVKPTPEVDTTPEVKPTPEVTTEIQTTPEVVTTPEVDTTTEVDTTPEVKPTPEVNTTPEVKPTPEVTTEIQTTPEVVTTPEVDTTTEVDTIPEEHPAPDNEENMDPNPCPPQHTEEAVLIPHPIDCTKFFKCNNGVPYVKDCPAGLAFNPTYLFCDYRGNVSC